MAHQEESTVLSYQSCFDVIGPIMIGPSSSHTAGAVSIGLAAYALVKGEKIVTANIHYYESFAETHLGHGTDYAIASGILGFATDDLRVPNAITIAKEARIDLHFHEEASESPIAHANTAEIHLVTETGKKITVIGASIGGGMTEVRYIAIDDFYFWLDGVSPIVLCFTQEDRDLRILTEYFLERGLFIHQEQSFIHDGQLLYVFQLTSKLSAKHLSELPILEQSGRSIIAIQQ